MATALYSGLTGCGYQAFSGSGTNDVVRINVTAVGSGGKLPPFGDPQRYGGLGWVAAYDFVPSGFDGVFAADTKVIVNPIIWLDTLWAEFDLTPLNTDLFGVSGMAYGLNPGVTIDIYQTEF